MNAGSFGNDGQANTGPPESGAQSIVRSLLGLCVVLGASLLLGNLVAVWSAPLAHNKMLPWILGRSLGLAAYLALTTQVVVGIVLRHPWRTRIRAPRAETLLRAHVALAASTAALLLGHVVALALDRYAGVGWVGALVPWHAQYRPTAVTLGTLGLYAIALVAVTAALAGSIARRIWFPVHTVSASVFGVVLVHGVLAGSDTRAMRWMYAASGALVVFTLASRWVARYATVNSEAGLG